MTQTDERYQSPADPYYAAGERVLREISGVPGWSDGQTSLPPHLLVTKLPIVDHNGDMSLPGGGRLSSARGPDFQILVASNNAEQPYQYAGPSLSGVTRLRGLTPAIVLSGDLGTTLADMERKARQQGEDRPGRTALVMSYQDPSDGNYAVVAYHHPMSNQTIADKNRPAAVTQVYRFPYAWLDDFRNRAREDPLRLDGTLRAGFGRLMGAQGPIMRYVADRVMIVDLDAETAQRAANGAHIPARELMAHAQTVDLPHPVGEVWQT